MGNCKMCGLDSSQILVPCKVMKIHPNGNPDHTVWNEMSLDLCPKVRTERRVGIFFARKHILYSDHVVLVPLWMGAEKARHFLGANKAVNSRQFVFAANINLSGWDVAARNSQNLRRRRHQIMLSLRLGGQAVKSLLDAIKIDFRHVQPTTKVTLSNNGAENTWGKSAQLWFNDHKGLDPMHRRAILTAWQIWTCNWGHLTMQ